MFPKCQTPAFYAPFRRITCLNICIFRILSRGLPGQVEGCQAYTIDTLCQRSSSSCVDVRCLLLFRRHTAALSNDGIFCLWGRDTGTNACKIYLHMPKFSASRINFCCRLLVVALFTESANSDPTCGQEQCDVKPVIGSEGREERVNNIEAGNFEYTKISICNLSII